MKYTLEEVGSGDYVTYFFAKGFERVFKINSGPNDCIASVEKQYSAKLGVNLRNMRSSPYLPKYITKGLK